MSTSQTPERRRFWQRELLADHRYAALQFHLARCTQCAAAGELQPTGLCPAGQSSLWGWLRLESGHGQGSGSWAA